MKKLLTLLLITLGISVNAQSTLDSYTSSARFLSNDFLQIYQGARIAIPTMTLPNSLTTYTSTNPFQNNDLLQVYNAIRAIGSSTGSSSDAWSINGNSVTAGLLGTTSNNDFAIITNNIPRVTFNAAGTLSVANTVTLNNAVNNGTTLCADDITVTASKPSLGSTKIKVINTSTTGFSYLGAQSGSVQGFLFVTGQAGGVGAGAYDNSNVMLAGSPDQIGIVNENVNGNMGFYVGGYGSNKEAIRIYSTGNVAIQGFGATHPIISTATLNVQGTFSASSTSTLNGCVNNSTITVTGAAMIGGNTAGSATLHVLGTASVSSTSTLTGLRNNGTFTTTGATMIGGTTAGSATLHVLGTASVSGSSTLTGVLSTSSVVSTSKTAGIGYAVGSGSTVTQGTSRTTDVIINDVVGSITLFSTAGSATWQSFTMTNSTIGINDVIVVNQRSGTDLYMIEVTAVAAGSCRISFATTGGTTSEAPVFNYAVIKGATN